MNRSIILRLLESYFRHRWLHLIPIVLLTGVGIAYVFTRPHEYLTEGLVHVPGESYLATLTDVRPDTASWWATPAQRTANEIQELLRTDTFIKSIIAQSDLAPELGGSPTEVNELITEIRKLVWAVPQGDNQVQIATQHENPVVAYQLASATIENYTQWRIDAELAQSTVAQDFFAELIPGYEAEAATARQALDDYLMAHPAPVNGNRPDIEQVEIDRLRAVLSQAQDKLTDAQQKDQAAQLAASQAEVNVRQAFYVMDAPTIPTERNTSLRKLAQQVAVFFAAGVGLTVAAVVGGALLNRGYLFPFDVEENLKLPVLATVPEARRRTGWRRGQRRSDTQDFVLSPPLALAALPAGSPPTRSVEVASDEN